MLRMVLIAVNENVLGLVGPHSMVVDKLVLGLADFSSDGTK